MRVHLLDGTYELFRQFFGQPPRRAADGTEIGATYGVVTSVLAITQTASLMAATFADLPATTM